jgi:hypothetical protein
MSPRWFGFRTSTSPISSESISREGPLQPAVVETVVASFATLLEAELARGRLHAEGIAARLLDEFTVGVAAHFATMAGGVRLVVPDDDLDLAREILADTGEPEAW